MNKSELLVDYCQKCGEEIGSFECCQSGTIHHTECPECGNITVDTSGSCHAAGCDYNFFERQIELDQASIEE